MTSIKVLILLKKVPTAEKNLEETESDIHSKS